MQLWRGQSDLVTRQPTGLGDLAELRLQLAAHDMTREHKADITARARIDQYQALDYHVQAGLLPRLAGGRRVWCLAVLDTPAGEHPAGSEIGGPHHQETTIVIGGEDVGALDAAVSASEQAGELHRPTDQQPRDVGGTKAWPTAHQWPISLEM